MEVGYELPGWKMFLKWHSIKIIYTRGLTVCMFSIDPAIAWSAVGKAQHLVGCPPGVVVSHLFPSYRVRRALMTVDITMP